MVRGLLEYAAGLTNSLTEAQGIALVDALQCLDSALSAEHTP
ncbi:hypothetical protein [Nocardia alni]|nr:hypothetical protein [Nocardia alni]